MKIEKLSKEKAVEVYDSFVQMGYATSDVLSSDYQKIRMHLIELQNNMEAQGKKDYDFDLNFAIEFYEYIKSLPIYSEKLVANFDFWRYLCCCVAPDVIENRHGLLNPDYFYKKELRMYFPTMWWYIDLAWQGSKEKTYKVLNNLSTDYIMQLVERPGKDGLYKEITRELMRVIGTLSPETRNRSINGANLFRRVMIQNTAKIGNYKLIMFGEAGTYVKGLFADCGVEVE